MQDKEPTNDLFRSVLDTDGGKFVADGPLSSRCAEVLHELYQIKTDEETGLAIETQMIEQFGRSAWVAASLARNQLEQSGDSAGLLYGVDSGQATMSDTVDASNSIAGMTPSERKNSVVYIETPSEEVSLNPFAQVIKRVADQNGIDVAVGMEEFRAILKKRGMKG